jgi:hypothetical protein
MTDQSPPKSCSALQSGQPGGRPHFAQRRAFARFEFLRARFSIADWTRAWSAYVIADFFGFTDTAGRSVTGYKIGIPNAAAG